MMWHNGFGRALKPAVMYNSGILAYNPDSNMAVVVEMTEFFSTG